MENFKYLINMGMGGQNETHLQKKMADLRETLKQYKIDEDKTSDISTRLDEIDFILNKYDDFFEEFSKVATSLAGADFKQRFNETSQPDDFLSTLTGILNTVIDELQQRAMKTKMIEYTFDLLALRNTIVIMTDTNGVIEFIHGNITHDENFNEQVFIGDKINSLFKDFKQIERRIRSGLSPRDIEVLFFWNGGYRPCHVDTSVCIDDGKIEGMIYIINAPYLSDN